MFKQEAEWIKEVLANIYPLNGYNSVANLGSSTIEFRTKVQPHIHNCITLPLENKGWKISHVDFKKEDGVDIVADLTNIQFGEKFKNRFAVTICTNMLEHVENIGHVINNLLTVTKNNGYILITVPYKYKIHHDPIDNGFRPTPNEIYSLFSGNNINVQDIAHGIITITDKSYYRVKKSRIPFWGYRERLMYYFGKRHKVSGILLKIHK